jgi:hypothetical protein
VQRDARLVARRTHPLRRLAAAGLAAGLLALAAVVAAPWLSASASASTVEPCDWESYEPSSPVVPCSSSGMGYYSSSDPPCLISQGIYPFPSTGTSRWQLPSWVQPLGSSVCVALDASSLTDLEAGPQPVTVDNWPSDSPGSASLLSALNEWREMYLYSVGILIFCGGALVARSRVM